MARRSTSSTSKKSTKKSSKKSSKKSTGKTSKKPAKVSMRERLSDWVADIAERLEERRLGTTLRIAVWVIAVVGTAVAAIVWIPRLKTDVGNAIVERASQNTEHKNTVILNNAPEWYAGTLEDEVTALVFSIIDPNPFNQSSLVEVQHALQDSGLFSDVRQVRRESTYEVAIDVTFRIPFAMVEWNNDQRMIDDDGWLLPPGFKPGSSLHFVNIKGVTFPPPEEAGGHWDGGDIPAAISIIRLIETQPWYNQVKAIDVTDYQTDDRIVLVTDLDTRLVWESAPGAEQAGEVSADEKLRRLESLYEKGGRIDDRYVGEIDLSRPGAIWATDY